MADVVEGMHVLLFTITAIVLTVLVLAECLHAFHTASQHLHGLLQPTDRYLITEERAPMLQPGILICRTLEHFPALFWLSEALLQGAHRAFRCIMAKLRALYIRRVVMLLFLERLALKLLVLK